MTTQNSREAIHTMNTKSSRYTSVFLTLCCLILSPATIPTGAGLALPGFKPISIYPREPDPFGRANSIATLFAPSQPELSPSFTNFLPCASVPTANKIASVTIVTISNPARAH
jgi:hypothetical protein